MSSSAQRRRLFDKVSESDGLPPPDAFVGGWVSVAETRAGDVTITHADCRILVESEYIYLIVEGKGPDWVTLHPPASGDQKNLLAGDDIRETGVEEFVDWSVHIRGAKRTLVYVLVAYRGAGLYEAHRVD